MVSQVLAGFRVTGRVRFLSHSETLRVVQRACVRGGFAVAYSAGFNPHPRISLPLPRSVGVETDCDLASIFIGDQGEDPNGAGFGRRLEERLPAGFEITDVRLAGTNSPPRPISATYVFSVPRCCADDAFRSVAQDLPARHEEIVRDYGGRRKWFRPSDYIKNSRLEDDGGADVKVAVECRITTCGSIRVDEIISLLGLDVRVFSAPVRRTSVCWET